MKKNNKVYSVSDFSTANVSVVIDTCLWTIDDVFFTNVGEYSKSPLFELQLKRVLVDDNSDIPEGFVDMSQEMVPNRTYFVREGRPLFTTLAGLWDDLCGETEDVRAAIMAKYRYGVFKGRVERLSGVEYTYTTKRGTVASRSKCEFWYPEYLDEGYIKEDFVYLCNRGVYSPTIKEEPNLAKAISDLDPKIVEAIMALKK